MSSFHGFPQEATDFLAKLAANNERDWFNANKKTYEDAILAPMQAFVEEMGPRLQEISPGISYDTRTNGAGSMMRIYRDTRFSKDKTPYKTNVAAVFWEGTRKKMQNSCFGIQWGAEGGGLMAGLHGFDKDLLAAYRQAVVDDTAGTALTTAIEQVRSAGDYEVGGEHYKRVPRGFDADHPRADLLRYAGLYAYSPHIPVAALHSPDLIDLCLQHFRVMAPIHTWLVQIAE